MSSGKVPTRNVVQRPAAPSAPTPSREPARPTQRLTTAQRDVLLEDMREQPVAQAGDDEELEVEIQVGGDESAAPAKKRAATNAHVARRTK